MLCQVLARKYKLMAKDLFLKYALPCLHNKVEKGEMTEEEMEEAIERFRKGDITNEEINEWFNVAMPNVVTGAINQNKEKKGVAEVDENVVRQYFWYDHDRVVKSRLHEGDYELCLVLPAKVDKVKGKKAEVEHPFGERTVDTRLVEGVEEGDYMTIHYYFGCEKIGKEEAKKLWKKKFLS